MTKHKHLPIIILLVVMLCTSTAPLCQTPSQDYDIITTDTNLVTLNVSVTNNKKRPITDLMKDDFAIKDDGSTIKPEFFDSHGPASIIFVLDISTSMRGLKWQNLHDGLKDFLKKQKESDFTLIVFNERPKLVARSVSASQFWKIFESIKPDGETALYDGLSLGLDQVSCLSRRHKAIVLLSDGEDNSSKTKLAKVQEEVFATHTTIYAVGILIDSSAPITERYKGRDLLIELAAATGGSSFFPTPYKIEPVLDDINAEISTQYSFGYYPPSKAGGWRNVDVQLTRFTDKANLRYQQRYLLK